MIRTEEKPPHTIEPVSRPGPAPAELVGWPAAGPARHRTFPAAQTGGQSRVNWLRRGLGGAESLLQRSQAGNEHAIADGGDRLVLVRLVAVELRGPLDVGVAAR